MRRFTQKLCGQRGWFIGSWPEAAYQTDAVEVAHGLSLAGDHSPAHYHKLATEINVITSGEVMVNGEIFRTGEGFIIEPGETCEATYIKDTWTLVVKLPGAYNDKYMYE
jgi:hypothetical protein